MHTDQIAQTVLENYKNDKLSEDRITFLKTQAKEQLDEISQNRALYESFLQKVNAPETIDNIVLWILLMSNEALCESYISALKKEFREIIPISDLADLLLYILYLKKVKNIALDGVEYLLEYEHDGKDEVDQYCFTNVLLFVQQSKEVEIQF